MNNYEKAMGILLIAATVIFVIMMMHNMAEAHLQENLYKVLRGM